MVRSGIPCACPWPRKLARTAVICETGTTLLNCCIHLDRSRIERPRLRYQRSHDGEFTPCDGTTSSTGTVHVQDSSPKPRMHMLARHGPTGLVDLEPGKESHDGRDASSVANSSNETPHRCIPTLCASRGGGIDAAESLRTGALHTPRTGIDRIYRDANNDEEVFVFVRTGGCSPGFVDGIVAEGNFSCAPVHAVRVEASYSFAAFVRGVEISQNRACRARGSFITTRHPRCSRPIEVPDREVDTGPTYSVRTTRDCVESCRTVVPPSKSSEAARDLRPTKQGLVKGFLPPSPPAPPRDACVYPISTPPPAPPEAPRGRSSLRGALDGTLGPLAGYPGRSVPAAPHAGIILHSARRKQPRRCGG